MVAFVEIMIWGRKIVESECKLSKYLDTYVEVLVTSGLEI